MNKKLYKSAVSKQICGVCGGIAEYFDIDPTLVRIITVMLFLSGTIGLWVYIVAAIIMPEAPSGYDNDEYNNNYYNDDNNQ